MTTHPGDTIRIINSKSAVYNSVLQAEDVYPDGAISARFALNNKTYHGTFTKNEFEVTTPNPPSISPPTLTPAEIAKRNGLCACGCKRILRTTEPFLVYGIRGDPRKFATKECRDAAFSGLKRNPNRTDPTENTMRVHAEDFGEAAPASRLVCDNPACGKPIVINWQGTAGDYCSLECRRAIEGLKENSVTDETTTTSNASPIQAAAPSKPAKKATKKAAAKAAKKVAPDPVKKTAPAAAKKAAPASAPAPGKSKYPDNAKLFPTNTAEGLGYRAGTKRESYFSQMKKGMLVTTWKEAVGGDASSFLKFYVDSGAVAVQ